MQDIQTATAPRIDIPALLQGYRLLRETEPGLRARDAAQRLGVSEGALVASRVGDGVTRLEGELPDIIRDLPALGRVMALTRNEYCVHEKKGAYDHIDIGGAMGIVLAEDIDLRLFLRPHRLNHRILGERIQGVGNEHILNDVNDQQDQHRR